MFTGENAKAAEAMQKAVDLNPHDHTLWRNLADSYRQVPSLVDRLPRPTKALEVAQEQLTVNPTDKDALSGVALYEAHLGDNAEAQKYITKASATSAAKIATFCLQPLWSMRSSATGSAPLPNLQNSLGQVSRSKMSSANLSYKHCVLTALSTDDSWYAGRSQ